MPGLLGPQKRCIPRFRSMWKHQKTLDRLQDDLCQLRRRMDDLAVDQKRVVLDNAELYEKTLRLMQRMAKRYAVDNPVPPEPPDPNSSDSPSVGSDPISKSIMLRRGMPGAKP